jgi:hypothetical protein
MLIFGHKFINSESFYLIKRIEHIKKTPSNSTVIFEFNELNLELCYYCQQNSVKFAVIADNVKDILFSSSLDASFIVCDKVLAPKAQKYADEYMFDAKILLYSSDDEDLEWSADLGIDGVLFEKGIDYGSC